jgi:hypothetical protein
MRKSFGIWLVERRVPRVALIAGLLPLGLLGILSAAIVVCVAGLKGWREATVDCLIALGILMILMVAMGAGWVQVAVSAASTWVAAVCLGSLTGAYASLTLSLQTILVLGVLGILLFVLTVPDSKSFWDRFLTDFIEQMASFGVDMAQPDVFLSLAPMMSGLVAASLIMSSIAALLLGSWWASGAGGPGFKAMFLQIRLGYVIGGMATIAGLGAIFGLGPTAGNVLMVLAIGFVFQGLAVAHWQVANRGWPWTFLLAVYVPFLLGASLAAVALLLFAGVGFVDNWYGLRRTSSGAR